VAFLLTGRAKETLAPNMATDLLSLPIDKVLAEYIWIGGSGQDLRCKTMTLDKRPRDAKELPIWNFDGSSTGQAPGHDSEILLHPQRIFKDPFRGGDHILVLCSCTFPDGRPVETNRRDEANKIFEKAKDHIPWFGLEQEYTLFKDGRPLGWPANGYPAPQGPYYCSVGATVNHGRTLVEEHYRACLYAGITISGINAEVLCGQWEFQVGPCEGIKLGDELWMARYILKRVAERHGVDVSLEPKPISGDWNGSGLHMNFSTVSMREEGGYEHIISGIKRLEPKHREHIAVYGEGNEKRLTGRHETASIDKFSYGVADRGASIRIPRQVHINKKGYFEDRRPASNADPYLITGKIVKTVVLNE
jgi:glutamine synthetase